MRLRIGLTLWLFVGFFLTLFGFHFGFLGGNAVFLASAVGAVGLTIIFLAWLHTKND